MSERWEKSENMHTHSMHTGRHTSTPNPNININIDEAKTMSNIFLSVPSRPLFSLRLFHSLHSPPIQVFFSPPISFSASEAKSSRFL